MIESKVTELIQASLKLKPAEQLELIAAVTRSLRQIYTHEAPESNRGESNGIYSLNRTPPLVDLASLKADFWPEDEPADALNDWITQQRQADRSSDL
jgi:hypothetical protein